MKLAHKNESTRHDKLPRQVQCNVNCLERDLTMPVFRTNLHSYKIAKSQNIIIIIANGKILGLGLCPVGVTQEQLHASIYIKSNL